MKSLSKIFFVAALLGLCYSNSFAQMGRCGTKGQQMIVERLSHNREVMQDFSRPRNVVEYVPVKVHLVAKSDGTGGPNEVEVLEMMCILNEEYEDQGIQFYMSNGFNYVNSSNIYIDPGSAPGIASIRNNKVYNAINIFISGSTGDSDVLAYYQPPATPSADLDFIVADQRYIRGRNVVPHEIGHFFSLAHPFFGWEGHPWDPAIHGISVGNTAPSDPTQIGPNNGIPNEKNSGSNCSIAADRICDTAPDYLFAYSPGQYADCVPFTGGAQDPDGVEVDPSEDNIMSYFDGCPSYEFTAGQKTAIEMDLFSSNRAYIRPNYTPTTTPIVDDPVLNYPIGGATTAGYNIVEFDWEPVAGASSYILQVDELPTFNFEMRQFVVTSTFKAVEDFKANRNYYWRVRPYGEYHTCAKFSDDERFKTSSVVSTEEPKGIKGWSVQPNPLRQGESLIISMDSEAAFEGLIELYSITGQRLHDAGQHGFDVGSSNLELVLPRLSPGIYILTIRTAEGMLNTKVVMGD